MGRDLTGRDIGEGFSQRKDGRYWRAYRYNGKQKFVYGATLKECKAHYREVLLKMEAGEIRDKSTTTLNAYFENWKQMLLEKKAIKPSTYAAYTNQYKHIKAAFGYKKIEKITTTEIRQLQADLVKQGYKPKTVNSIMGLLSNIFQEMIRDEIIFRNPCNVLRPVKQSLTEERSNARALTEEEEALFIKYAEGTWYCNAIRLLFATGMRSGELRALTYSCIRGNMLQIRQTATVDKDGKSCVNIPKTANSVRDIPINNTIRKILKDQKEQNKNMFGESVIKLDGYIFRSIEGKMMSRNVLKKAFNTICNRIEADGIPFERISPHACRHTFITRSLMKGYNEFVVKDIVGHSHSAKVTLDVYLHKDEKEMEKFMNDLDKAN